MLTINGFEMTLTQDFPPLSEDRSTDFTQPYTLPDPPPKKVVLSGTYERLDITGIQWRNRRFQCLRCGEDLLFDKQEKEKEDEKQTL